MSSRELTLREPHGQSSELANLAAHPGSPCRFGAPATVEFGDRVMSFPPQM
jgi:hypothetical protein